MEDGKHDDAIYVGPDGELVRFDDCDCFRSVEDAKIAIVKYLLLQR